MKKIISASPTETEGLARKLARLIITLGPRRSARVVTLRGNLGSGKTTFAKGFFRALGVRRSVSSPTFVLIKRYPIRISGFETAYHVDAYRLKNPRDLGILGFREIVREPRNIVLVEWPERASSLVPRGAVRVGFAYGKKGNERVIWLQNT